MPASKYLGIWMDHSTAHLTELTPGELKTTVINAKSIGDTRHGEQMMHNKERQKDHDYYQTLGNVIKGYKEVLLFGPTNAKTELHNMMKADHLFGEIRIDVKSTDKMTSNQQHAFVKEHFSRH